MNVEGQIESSSVVEEPFATVLPQVIENDYNVPEWTPKRFCGRRRRNVKNKDLQEIEVMPPDSQITSYGRLSKKPQRLGF